MICRARPKYITSFDKNILNYNSEKDTLYFNSGSNAAKFFFKCYAKYYPKVANIAIQDFTCSTMLDALNATGHQIFLYDVCLEDCSLDFEQVENEENLDVIILTHYQGIPNKDYLKFKQLCDKKGILLFEDCSHGNMSMHGDVRIGSLSNVYIESFAWDKPYTSLRGGALHLNDLERDFKFFLKEEYNGLKRETDSNKERDMQVLKFMFAYTAEKNYNADVDYTFFDKFSVLIKFWNSTLFKSKLYRKNVLLFYKLLSHIRRENSNSEILKLHPEKIGFIQAQKHQEISKGDIKKYVLQIVHKYNLNEEELLFLGQENDNIVWNRYSLIDKNGRLASILKKEKIDAGNFNWSTCLHEHVPESSSHVFMQSDFKYSKFLSKHIVNIPNWFIKEQE